MGKSQFHFLLLVIMFMLPSCSHIEKSTPTSTPFPTNWPSVIKTPDAQDQIDEYVLRVRMELNKCAEASQQFYSALKGLNSDMTNPDSIRDSLVGSIETIKKLQQSCSNLSTDNPPETMKGLNEILKKIEEQILLFSSTTKTCVETNDVDQCRQSVFHSKDIVNSFKELFESDYWELLFPQDAEV